MAKESNNGFKELAEETKLYPQEALLKVQNDNKNLFIGVPKETDLQENRVALTPEAVALLVNNGHQVCVEAGAGLASKFDDRVYSDAGAKIVYSAQEAFEADIVFKIEPPSLKQVGYMKPGKSLISALMPSRVTSDYINALTSKKIIALGFEYLEDKVGGMPVVRAMSEIAGSTVMLIASEYLSCTNNGQGVILGGITGVPPTKVIILGAGTVAEYAARAALGLGVDLEVYDNHIYKLRRLKHALGHQIHTSTLDNVALADSLKDADVVIGAMRPEKGRTRYLVTEEMVAQMKSNSVIIDVTVDQGYGCFETTEMTTHKRPVYTKYDVIHYCVPNIAARVAKTASTVISNIFSPLLIQMGEVGGMDEMIYRHKWFLRGIYAYRGSLTNASVAKKLGMKYKDLELLLAARF